jgi:glycosyltransferase involved in cell wall biosynthesis
MKIGVNLLYLRPGEVGGGEIYVRELLSRLPQPGDRCFVYCWEGAAEALASLGTVSVRPIFRGRYSHARRLWCEGIDLAGECGRDGVEVLLSPGNFAPLRVPPRTPVVTTVHDLQHLWFPGNFSLAQRAYRSAMFSRTIATTDRIIAISDFTRDDVIARLRVAPESVERVYSGAPDVPSPTFAQLAAVKERHALPGRFFYYPAALGTHKNHGVLFAALARAREELRADHHLVLTGATLGCEAALAEATRTHAVAGHVHHLGFVPAQDVHSIMSLATALVLPSRFEGFGLPVLEAMRCGVPVIASDRASVPEIVGRAGILIDPDDVEAWARQMVRVAEDATVRQQLVAAGQENLGRFSWNECARHTRAVLQDACERRSRSALRPSGKLKRAG